MRQVEGGEQGKHLNKNGTEMNVFFFKLLDDFVPVTGLRFTR